MADVRAFMLRNRRRLRQTFSVFDANGGGTVSVEEMVRGLQGINDSALTTEQIRAAIASLDSDRSGYIDYLEFCEGLSIAEAPDGSVPRVHALAAAGDRPALVAEVTTHGAAVDGRHVTAANWRGRTALMVAAHNGRLGAITALLAQSADANAVDTAGWTALHCAAAGGHAEVCRAPCRAGADTARGNDAGLTASQLAETYGFADVLGKMEPYLGKDRAEIPEWLRPAPTPYE